MDDPIVLDDVHGVTLSRELPGPTCSHGGADDCLLSGTFDGVGARPPLCRAIEARNTSGVGWRAEGARVAAALRLGASRSRPRRP